MAPVRDADVALYDRVRLSPSFDTMFLQLWELPRLKAAQDAVAPALAAVAAGTSDKHAMFGLVMHETFYWEALATSTLDRAFVSALVASKAFDVAIVTFEPSVASREGSGAYVISKATLCPALRLPVEAASRLVGRSVGAFLRSRHTDPWSSQCTTVVFWPTSRRAAALGIPIALKAFEAHPETAVHAGVSLRWLVESLVQHISQASAQDVRGWTMSSVLHLCRMTNALGTVDLVAQLWASPLLTKVIKQMTVGGAVATLRDAFERLGLNALYVLLQQLMAVWQSHDPNRGFALLVEIAGLKRRPVCPLFDIPNLRELILAGYVALVAVEPKGDTWREAVVSNCVFLEEYVWHGSLDGAWLRHRLPDLPLRLIDAFRLPSDGLARLARRRAVHPWSHLAPALHALWPRRLPRCEELFLSTVLTANDYDNITNDQRTTVLRVLQALGSLTHAALLVLVNKWRTHAPGALWGFLNGLPNSGAVQVPFSATARMMLVELQKLSVLHDADPTDPPPLWTVDIHDILAPMGAQLRRVFASLTTTVDLLRRWSPTHLGALITGLLDCFGDNLSWHRHFALPLLQTFGERRLATATLAVLQAEAVVDLPQLVDVAFGDLVLPPCACCCCRRLQAFLHSPSEVTCHLETDMAPCPSALAFTACHPTRVTLDMETPHFAVAKLLPLHGVPPAELAAYETRLDERHADIDRIAWLQAFLRGDDEETKHDDK
ncbi:hypothetical protein SDRG_14072 [Saprolegnia diclina VS20]|uniref:Uncharacterized protein n=1 Tax=Saprolegnia diclina (strain VS20) TaxID=1156394 RepID=T0PRX4_SAPDV|nr:hypothetical protein SDRG_14072 [Saprolegnia diclina VS20]EQC28249.1 hypothetical protein SDRG_14072 [Saprolegnia diclina VS20]|eukprot:XP_008618398.1 hypothetical protein SDRG_14072 [Saprolegnia diclina VS20]